MNQVERIKTMEQLYDKLRREISDAEQMFQHFQQIQEEIKVLSDYYTSSQWKQDVMDDENGKIHPELKRGVLSQDAIYLLLEENDELIRSMQQFTK